MDGVAGAGLLDATSTRVRSGSQNGHDVDLRDGDLTPRSPRGRGETQLTYVPGLDGLRAISVLAVMLYHFRPDRSLLPGGYLGVEVFFVISGYLITSLLLSERRKRGKIRLGQFWVRRIRRLWPALGLMLIVTGIVLSLPPYNESLGRLKGDLFFGFYAENWWQIFHGVSYFARDTATTLRQPFQHLWSLAVEEQFYLFWPIELAAGLFLLGRKHFRWFLVAQVVIAYGIMVWLAWEGSTNHAYLGTETRMTGILLGCLLAFHWSPTRLRGPAAPTAGRTLDLAAISAMAVLVLLFFTLHQGSTGLYYWGLPLVDVCTVVLIMAIMHPASRANRSFGIGPLRTVGLRSYGIYLWGIAIFEFTRPGIDWDPPALVVWIVRIALVTAVVEASYRFVELPIRRGELSRSWQELRTGAGDRHHRTVVRWQAALVALSLAVAGLATAAVAATDRENCKITGCVSQLGGGNGVLAGGTVPSAAPGASTPTTAVHHPTTGKGSRPGKSTTPTTSPTVPASQSKGWSVTAVGDSVMLGAGADLASTLTPVIGQTYVNAAVSRGDQVCVQTLQQIKDQGALAGLVLVHCGNNGTLNPNFVDQVMQIAGPHRHVVFYTLKVPRGWEGPNNAEINTAAKKYPNARVLDWNFFGTHNPASMFYSDQYHLTPPGRALYARVTLEVLRDHWHWA
jgi:peptidoglycan/LPS O-acetylase OafA/YrhL